MKKGFFIILAALLFCVQGFSQSAREILEKVFENMEKNYNLSESYRQYDIKGLRFHGDSLVKAYSQLVVMKTPKNVKKKAKMVASYIRGYPDNLWWTIWLEINPAVYSYKKYLKNKKKFFEDFTEISVSPPLEGYVIKFKQRDKFYTMYISMPDYTITKCIYEKEEKNPQSEPHILSSRKVKRTKVHVYAECEKVGDKYEVVYCKSEIENDVVHLSGREYKEREQFFIEHITTSDEMILQKNAKGKMSYEEALRLAKSM